MCARRRGERLTLARVRIAMRTLISYIVMRFGIPVGDFEPAHYRRTVVENSDFRKYDDTLRMTLDCAPAVADRLEERLGRAAAQNIVRFGMHRQARALMTCIVPSITDNGHIHFVDGAAGGYAMAARRQKQSAGSPAGEE